MIVLRNAGVRLRKADWPAPVRGDLRISDWDGASNSFKRHVRQAELWGDDHPTIKRLLRVPIFDPVILRTVNDGFLLSGIELDSSDSGRVVAEHVQIWLCRPVGAASSKADHVSVILN
ncbi:MAG: hypothetical protein IAE92_02545 [Burkholderiaceae bacterium]|nr:hypothetical protein [Burkholderiaceae bacterium]